MFFLFPLFFLPLTLPDLNYFWRNFLKKKRLIFFYMLLLHSSFVVSI